MNKITDSILAATVAGGSFTAINAAQQAAQLTPTNSNILAIATALITGVIAPLVKEWVIDHRNRRRAKKQKKNESTN